MTDFDKKEHVNSPEGYRNLAGQIIIGLNSMHDAISTALNMELPSQSEILVIGGGGGKEISSLHKFSNEWNFTVIDPSEKMIQLAKYWSEREGIQSRTKILKGYLQDYNFLNSTFDAITCIAVLHYLDNSERLNILQQVKKLLKPNGLFVWTVGVKPETEEELDYLKKTIQTISGTKWN